ncbi:nucleoside-diphosphate sugar epimerase [Autumnicola psychrophila]|uniref:Nucleoside-diphosphate sugar epimerase n=1 Tax=Autumnicola psychrophila TaxID=3075592 RepID=A0ABU3DW25_9FLAO|nr:nucleoside-diphosphate sugar epimerase [Zunongwangia sp. F225]MDT0687900.1 nucleoside-diphosphate sugar epimerase [Zunongwangia sp. F225]
MKTAIILGATGLTGGILLRKLLDDDRYGKIILFSRSSANLDHSKIEEHLVDLFHLKEHSDKFKADEVYCCIGTTKSKTPDKDVYKKIDHGIPVAAAGLCEKNAIPCYVLISAMGADPKSKIFYSRIKGKTEKDVLEYDIKKTYILKPSLIVGDREENRTGEKIAKFVMEFFKPLMIGSLKKYRPITPEEIASAMIFLANDGHHQTRIESEEIRELANSMEKE